MDRRSFFASVRVRMAVLYTFVVFGVGALLVGTIYFTISASLTESPVTADLQLRRVTSEPGAAVWLDADALETIEQLANAGTLDRLRTLSLTTLGVLFPVSLLAGWFIAGKVLRPVDEIAAVAEEIQASDLSRRIRMAGPNDELRHLADTFDAMLDRVEQGVEDQRRFIQDVSHELRNPLATMSMSLDVVLGDDDSTVEEFKETAEVLRRSIDRTSQTVDGLMRFARRELPTAAATPVDLGVLAKEVLSELHGPARTRRIHLEHPADVGPTVLADHEAVRSAIANLASNAVRLAPEGSTVTCGSGSDDRWVWVGIRDEGPGIDPVDHHRVFRRNWGKDDSRFRGESRAGLGLSIVRQVAEDGGGTVTLSSSPDWGSSFVIWLPIVPDADPSEVASADGVHPRYDPLLSGDHPGARA